MSNPALCHVAIGTETNSASVGYVSDSSIFDTTSMSNIQSITITVKEAGKYQYSALVSRRGGMSAYIKMGSTTIVSAGTGVDHVAGELDLAANTTWTVYGQQGSDGHTVVSLMLMKIK